MGLLLVALLIVLDAFWIEPRLLVVRREATVPLAPALRIAHLSDLHVATAGRRLDRLAEAVVASRPDVVLVSGDLIDDVKEPEEARRHAEAAGSLVARLAATAPVYAVQGHSDYLGSVMATLAERGVTWLANEGVALADGEALLVGLSQQVGHDAGVGERPSPYRPEVVDGEPALAREHHGKGRNVYLSWDPAPAGLAATGGPLAWRDYDVTATVRIDRPGAAVGVAALSRCVAGDATFVRLAGGEGGADADGSFALVFDGSFPERGRLDTGVVPEPGRWYRLRLRTRSGPDRLLVRARAWAEGEAEPREWQAWAEDVSPWRARAGTVALWTWGGGTAFFRDLAVVGEGGRPLLREPFSGGGVPTGWRLGTRGTRLALALARSPEVGPAATRIVLAHSPDVTPEAVARGLDLVLAGHTHGGQVRVPGFGALVTRSALPLRFDRGLFRLDREGEDAAWLYINSGFGTSLLPVRFWNPGGFAVVDLVGREGR